MYNTVKSLFDAVAPVATLRLFILNNTNDTYRGGLVTLTATTMTVVYADDSSTETFLKSDSAALNAAVVSPWGGICPQHRILHQRGLAKKRTISIEGSVTMEEKIKNKNKISSNLAKNMTLVILGVIFLLGCIRSILTYLRHGGVCPVHQELRLALHSPHHLHRGEQCGGEGHRETGEEIEIR